MMFVLALRNIFRHRTRSLITLSTILFGCTALIFVGGFFDNVFWQMRTTMIQSQTGHLQVYKKGFLKNGKTDPYAYFIDDLPRVETLVKDIPEVDYVAGRIQFAGLLSTGETTVSFYGQGIDPAREKTIQSKDTLDLKKFYRRPDVGVPVVDQGEGLAVNDKNQVLIGRGLAETMEARPGMNVTLLTDTVDGSTNAMDMNTKGVFYTAVKSYDDIFLRVPLTTAQKLLNTGSVQSLVVFLHHTEDTAKVKEKIDAIILREHLDLEVKRWEDVTDFYHKTVLLFDTFHLIMRIVVSIVVILGVFNTMNMAMMERISEIGTLMAMGMKRKAILMLFMTEGFLLGTIGGVVGITIGSAIVHMIAMVGIMMPPAPGGTIVWLSEPSIVPSVLFSTVILCVFIGVIASFFPAYKASRLVITDALRYR